MPRTDRRRLWSRVNQQIFVWAGEEPFPIKFSGFRFLVPPRTETARSVESDPHSKYKFESARDSKDRLIPGSVVVKDVIMDAPNGGTHRVFDVAACCEYLQRDRPEIFDRGFAIVSDPKDVLGVLEEIQPLYDESQDRRAHKILQDELARQQKQSEKGQVPTERENPHVVEWALNHLARRGKTVKPGIGAETIQAVLEGRYDGPTAEPRPAEPQEDVPEPVERPDNKQLYLECEQRGVRLSKKEIEGLLTDDEKTVDFVASKLRAKREEASQAAS